MTRKENAILIMLLVVVILLLVANLALFVRMNQLQSQVIQALEPFQRPKGLSVGARAPDFNLVNTAGQEISFRDFREQRVLLAFISPNCAACQQVYPSLKEFHKAHPDIPILVVSAGTDAENQKVAAELSLPVLNGTEEIIKEYQVPGFPFFYLIDEEGRIASRSIAFSQEHLEDLIRAGQ